MNFDFSDDQKLLRDQARKFLTDKCDRSTVRTVLEDNSNHYSNDLWKSISEMGWTGTAIPEEYGGLGLGMLELCIIITDYMRVIISFLLILLLLLRSIPLSVNPPNAYRCRL